ncbi:MAG: NAD+ synthase [Candidatus Marinimicrobia bacterium]|nr:NAD+ synthase [Candidatus Neomarinimicrobiota bacterium]MCF7830059.1 NAD+ synthase [Candidatus Neomarinimicrobiota bacterium]MCF7882360.1 NAD+ synthase [Candidatus Neomarinimicrobiota bacterium]
MRVHLAQINPTVGDFRGNIKKITRYYQEAVKDGSECVIFPELAVTGYPPQDLLLVNQFIEENLEAIDEVAAEIGRVPAIVGFVDFENEQMYSAGAVIRNGQIQEVVHKCLLPTYDVFDEDRYFQRADECSPVTLSLNGTEVSLGVHICEDLWDNYHSLKVVDELASDGADLFINLSASPFFSGKFRERYNLAMKKVEAFGKPFVYCNLVGGQDELVFDGNSFVIDGEGNSIAWGNAFQEELLGVDIALGGSDTQPVDVPRISREEEMFRALQLGLRDYFRKSGFDSAVIGLSGGIDSSLVAVIAKEALGSDNVYGISMPSHVSSDHSKSDARQLAQNLGINFTSIPIADTYNAYLEMLKEPLAGTEPDTTEENIQARIRGNILMAYSNKFGHLVLSTGNKTELALGYCTLYGDMAGGLAVISDVNKMDVYSLCEWYNFSNDAEIIPENILTKPPSAELKEGQVDPFDYNVVSPLVDEVVENHRSVQSLVDMGYDRELAKDVIKKIRIAEYKRRQAAPGLKVTRKSFGSGRRMPIVNHYREEERT